LQDEREFRSSAAADIGAQRLHLEILNHFEQGVFTSRIAEGSRRRRTPYAVIPKSV
jgi:hypothetical protein